MKNFKEIYKNYIKKTDSFFYTEYNCWRIFLHSHRLNDRRKKINEFFNTFNIDEMMDSISKKHRINVNLILKIVKNEDIQLGYFFEPKYFENKFPGIENDNLKDLTYRECLKQEKRVYNIVINDFFNHIIEFENIIKKDYDALFESYFYLNYPILRIRIDDFF